MRLKVCGKALDGIGVTAAAVFEDAALLVLTGVAVVSQAAKPKALIENAALRKSLDVSFIMGAP